MTASSPFATLEQTFRLLSAAPHPLAIDGAQLGHGLPRRQIPIAELRWIILQPAASSDLQAAVVEAVIGRLARHSATWVVVLGGLLLPGMRWLANQTVADSAPLAIDVEAELLWSLRTVTSFPARDAHRFAIGLLQLAQASPLTSVHAQPDPQVPADLQAQRRLRHRSKPR